MQVHQMKIRNTLVPATVAAAAVVLLSSAFSDQSILPDFSSTFSSLVEKVIPKTTSTSVNENLKKDVTVTKIKDGDTVDIRKRLKSYTIRFAGIDTPESFSSKKLTRDVQSTGTTTSQMKKLGKTSTHALENLFDTYPNATVDVFLEEELGVNGRSIGTIYLVDEENNLRLNVNNWMVENGYACAYRNDPVYNPSEKIAQNAESGHWKNSSRTMSKLCR